MILLKILPLLLITSDTLSLGQKKNIFFLDSSLGEEVNRQTGKRTASLGVVKT